MTVLNKTTLYTAHTQRSRVADDRTYPSISSKASRKRISARKEFIEQNRMRLGFERKLRLQLFTKFTEIGQQAEREYNRFGNVDRTVREVEGNLFPMMASHYRAVIEEFGLRVVRNFKQESQFERLIKLYIAEQGAERVQAVSRTTVNQVRRIIAQGESEALGVSVIGRNIFKSMNGSFSRYRAATIARTETHNAASYANHEVNKSFNIPNQKKRWVSVADERTRPSHAAANGQEVGIDEDFIIDGLPMRYTGDPRGGARNVINCRCVILYVTPEDEVFVDETTTVAQKPIREPKPERNRGRKIEPINLGTLTVLKRKDVEKQLTEQLSEANDDPRYFNRSVTHYRGAKKEMYGKATLGRFLTDEGATVILALKQEMDEMMDRLDLPRIRSIQVKPSKRHNMAMGDGILYINPEYVDNLILSSSLRARQVNPADADRRFNELAAEQQKLTDEYNDNRQRMEDIRNDIDNMNRSDFDNLGDYFDSRNALVDEYKKLGTKNKRLYNKINKVRNEKDVLLEGGDKKLPVSEWTPNDPISERPFSSKNYLTDPLDRIRHTIYHEMGHQIHQTYQMRLGSSYVGSERQARGLDPFWTQVDRPLDKWLDKSRTETLLYGGGRNGNLKNPEAAKATWSTYGNYNGHEWFAENNANYWRGDLERVDPKFIKLMDNILEGKDIDDTSISVSE